MMNRLAALLGITVLLDGVEILHDKWRAAHVHAATEAEGFIGVDCATAEDRLLQMDLLRGRARGRLAEVLGAALR
jgi:penicillin amidase